MSRFEPNEAVADSQPAFPSTDPCPQLTCALGLFLLPALRPGARPGPKPPTLWAQNSAPASTARREAGWLGWPRWMKWLSKGPG